MKNIDEVMELITPTLSEAYLDGKHGVPLDFSEPEAMLTEYAAWYRTRFHRAPTARTMHIARMMNKLLADAYEAGKRAKEATA